MRCCFIAFFILMMQTLFAQVEVLPRVVQFGEVTRESDRVVDVLISNRGAKSELILRVGAGFEFETRLSSKTILPDSSVVLRIKFNPRERKVYNENLELWVASKQTPLLIPLKADVKYVNVNENLPCPTFGDRPGECCANNMFVVEVLESGTERPIEKAAVIIREDKIVQRKLETNANGRVTQEIPIGYYGMDIRKDGYSDTLIVGYINKRRNRFVVHLRKMQQEQVVEQQVESPQDSVIPTQVVRDSSLLGDEFKHNNIVFLLDISGSMAIGEKMALLQASIGELVNALRPEDQVGLISYANDAQVLLETTAGDHKSEMLEKVNVLHAQGKTAGAIGFKRAYKMLLKHAIEGGNNQLIVVTDGAFQPSDQAAIEKLVAKAARKGIVTSVLGIQCNNVGKDKLQLVSKVGFGSFLPLEQKADVQHLLLEEIKKQSRK